MRLKGKIFEIVFEGKTKKCRIEYTNGKVLLETSRAIVKERTLPAVGAEKHNFKDFPFQSHV
jgi:hypothetical protein